MSLIRRSLLLAAPALLAGCAAYPVAPGYYAGSYDYSTYGPPYYYQAAPAYVVPPGRHPHPGADGGHHAGTHSHGHSSGRGGGRGHR